MGSLGYRDVVFIVDLFRVVFGFFCLVVLFFVKL